MLITVGRIMMPRMMDAANSDSRGPQVVADEGHQPDDPRKPYTTEGMPARSSRVGFNTIFRRFGENSARTMAQDSPGHTDDHGPRVTRTEEMIMAKMPKWPLVGAQWLDRMKSFSPTERMRGKPPEK